MVFKFVSLKFEKKEKLNKVGEGGREGRRVGGARERKSSLLQSVGKTNNRTNTQTNKRTFVFKTPTGGPRLSPGGNNLPPPAPPPPLPTFLSLSLSGLSHHHPPQLIRPQRRLLVARVHVLGGELGGREQQANCESRGTKLRITGQRVLVF
jgi:hypothetical protein